MFFLPYLRDKKIEPLVLSDKNIHNGIYKNKKAEYQINKFNKLWQEIQNDVPYYNKLIKENKVPKKILQWDDFLQLPIADRTYMRVNTNEFIDTSKEIDHWSSTGGSTGNPLKFPKSKEEIKYNESNTWYSRTFYNVKRSDRMFRLWGHSHTYGKGISRYKNLLKFKIGLPLIGYKRYSAYNLSEKNLRKAGKEIIKFKPNYIIGYSKALNLLAAYNRDKKEEFHKLNLKVIIGASEGFDKEADKDFVSDIFGCDVALEYSSMETSIMAHMHPEGHYKVLWNNNLLECVDENGQPSDTGRVLITTLYPRAFPLIRYEIGDIIVNTKKDGHSVYEFKEVQGRDNDFLKLDEKTQIHPSAISKSIKSIEKILAFQIRYTKDFEYTIYLTSKEVITKKDKEEIKDRLAKIDKRLSKLKIKQVDVLKQTRAGKTKWLIEE